MIDVKHLSKSFGDHLVLKDISEHIYPGDKMVIIGPSGSGKSTFLRSLNLLEEPTSGTITFDGEVITDSFPTNTSDFSTYLSKAVSSGAEVIFCPVSISYSTQIVKLAASMGLEIPILGSDTLDSNMVLEAASSSDVKLYVSTFYQEGGSPEFDEGIKAWLNEDATAMTNNGGNDTIAAVTAMGYDAYYVALEALKAAGSTDPAAVKAALPGVTYTGVTGDIAFDDIGDAIRDTAYIKVADTANNAWALETMQKAG